MPNQFRLKMRSEYEKIISYYNERIDHQNSLKIDLHCHDKNSDVPDELWGRILRLPETWLETSDLIDTLKKNGTDLQTITNHNNARSCWDLLDKGIDVLVGAEFTCHFPEYDIYIHVLCFGFTPSQEEKLNQLRRNIYRFVAYCRENSLATIIPHPLYFYKRQGNLPMEIFEKFAILFERFEVLNGQRDLWQNFLALDWIRRLNEERIRNFEKKHGLRADEFCLYPYRKRLSGGTDDHMGIFAGSNGSILQIPDLENRRKHEKLSSLALEAILHNDMVPYGVLNEDEKLNIAFLDYFCQVGIHMKDPGLFRMFMHRGNLQDKLTCLLISNAMQELRRHKYTYRFLHVFHESLHGKKPSLLTSLSINKDYRNVLGIIEELATAKNSGTEAFNQVLLDIIPRLFNEVNKILVKRFESKVKPKISQSEISAINLNDLLSKLEVPSYLRALFGDEDFQNDNRITDINLSEIADQVTFPILLAGILAASAFTSTKVLYNGRDFLNRFAEQEKSLRMPHRILWITDTMFDKNGVSSVLQECLKYVRQNELPIDFLVCSNSQVTEANLIVVPALTEFSFPSLSDKIFYVPNLIEIQRLFLNGSYDRVICSTEFMMGIVAIYLKHAFSIPVFFYMHTDWLEYLRRINPNMDLHDFDRVRRLLRFFYEQFDGLFVLNQEHINWLAGRDFEIKRDKLFKTAHWISEAFKKGDVKRNTLNPRLKEDDFILIFAGRLSEEKGVRDVLRLIPMLKNKIPNLTFIFAGTGPMEEEIRSSDPSIICTGWVNQDTLIHYYSVSDLLILPSTFDTFACVVLEALACECPVVAYNSKGPADIIESGKSGYLASHLDEMSEMIIHHYHLPDKSKMKAEALNRSKAYQADHIMNQMMVDLQLSNQGKIEYPQLEFLVD